MINPIINRDITFAVTSTGNRALAMTLASVVNQIYKPGRVLIRLEGEYPSINDFYLEQVMDLGRVFGIEFMLCVSNSNGVREARDWLLDNCRSTYLWMGDDDVFYDPNCLWYLYKSMTECPDAGFIQGCKPDVNNRRGYGDFNRRVHTNRDVHDRCSYNQFYVIDPVGPSALKVKTLTADTGNMLVNLNTLRQHNIRFTQFEVSANASGEDTLFAGAVAAAKLEGVFCPCASGFHLEKPTGGFNEFGARTEMLYRAFEQKGYPKEVLEDFMPFQKRFRSFVFNTVKP